jgi:hypothetical protein
MQAKPRRAAPRPSKSKAALQQSVGAMLTAAGLGEYVENYRFVAETLGTGKGLRERLDASGLNDFQIDFAYPDVKIGIEVNGGQFAKSGHSSPAGLERDAKKNNQANILGWRIFVLPVSLVTPDYISQIAEFIKKEMPQ